MRAPLLTSPVISLLCIFIVSFTTIGFRWLRPPEEKETKEEDHQSAPSEEGSRVTAAENFLEVAKEVVYPIALQLGTSLTVYFAFPGLPPYFMKDKDNLRWVYLAFMVANTTGRVSAGYVRP